MLRRVSNMDKKIKRSGLKRGARRWIFFLAIVSLPVLQYFFFAIYTKFESVLMAFQKYKIGKGGYVGSFTWDNFEWAWDVFTSGGDMIGRSLIVMATKMVITIGGGLFFSYYAAKKYFMSNFFRVTLYLPQMLGGIVLVVLYQYLLSDVYITLSGDPTGLLDKGADSAFICVLFYNLWVGFGGNVMVFSTSMSGVNESVVEAARLEGITPLQEFLYIYIPAIYPTFVTYFIALIAGVFTDGLQLYTFFAGNLDRDLYPVVFGHYFFVKTTEAKMVGTVVTYPNLAALGIIFSIILTSIILPLRKIMLKHGPRED